MQSFDNSLKSPTKRLGVSLNVDTGYKGKAKENSPPVTPVQTRTTTGNTATANRALRGRSGPRETFLDDITPVDGSMMRENQNERGGPFQDSHDLSLSPRQITRDSLVENMLFSLDQYAYDGDKGGARQSPLDEQRLYSAFGDEDAYAQPQNFGPRNGRSASHGYSYSSDYENGDNSSQYSGHISRGRRSNSSSNFQPGLGRINSVRNEVGGNQGFGVSRTGSRGPSQIPPRGLHSRSGKGSKGSSANSLDLGYAQHTNNPRWAHGLAGRSSSFDFGSDRPALHAQSNNPLARQVNASVASFSPYDYDAAPTPTIPGGPSRPRPSSPMMLSNQEPSSPAAPPPKVERKRSTRSSKSAYKGKNPALGGRVDYGLHDRSRELPPMPAFVKETTAPAPLVGYGKAKEAAALPKEKQGFFRRVFGSSRNHPVIAPEPPRSHGSTTSAETTGERPNSKSHHIVSQMRTQHTPPSREAPPAPAPKEPTLTKKPSSFFRRRKKSTSEIESPVPVPAVPPMLVASQKEPLAARVPSSPVSSLRDVMNPYIRTPQRSPIDMFPQESIDRQMNDSPEPQPRNARGFSPEYEPSKIATIRAVKPPSRDAPSRDAAENITPSNSARKPYLSTGSYDSQSRDEQDATFLQDSSDNDRDGHSTSSRSVRHEPSDLRYHGDKKTITPAVARDMALVAEYERAYSKRSPTSTKFESSGASPADGSKSLDPKSSSKKIVGNRSEKEWVLITPTKINASSEPESRVWLEPSSSDEETPSKLALPLSKSGDLSQRTSGSTETVYKSATSLPIVQIEGEEHFEEKSPSRLMTATEASQVLNELVKKEADKIPGEDDREKAQRIFDGNEDFVTKEKATAWMGEEDVSRAKVLVAYMELYDFANLNILAALRVMCGRLVLKGESQQVDRILDTFAKRWCECNSDHGFKVTGKSAHRPCMTASNSNVSQMLYIQFATQYCC